jgi:hypothetical protein
MDTNMNVEHKMENEEMHEYMHLCVPMNQTMQMQNNMFTCMIEKDIQEDILGSQDKFHNHDICAQEDMEEHSCDHHKHHHMDEHEDCDHHHLHEHHQHKHDHGHMHVCMISEDMDEMDDMDEMPYGVHMHDMEEMPEGMHMHKMDENMAMMNMMYNMPAACQMPYANMPVMVELEEDEEDEKCHKDVDDILKKMEKRNPEILRLMMIYGMPESVAKRFLRRIIRLTLHHK